MRVHGWKRFDHFLLYTQAFNWRNPTKTQNFEHFELRTKVVRFVADDAAEDKLDSDSHCPCTNQPEHPLLFWKHSSWTWSRAKGDNNDNHDDTNICLPAGSRHADTGESALRPFTSAHGHIWAMTVIIQVVSCLPMVYAGCVDNLKLSPW